MYVKPSSTTSGTSPLRDGPIGNASEHLGFDAWRTIFQRTANKIIRDRVSLSAGSLAYHWFLALFPAVIAVLGFLSLLHVGSHEVDNLTHAINKGLPSGVASVFTNAVDAATARFLPGARHCHWSDRRDLERLRWNVRSPTSSRCRL